MAEIDAVVDRFWDAYLSTLSTGARSAVQVDESFVGDYGEGDGTPEWWRKEMWDHYVVVRGSAEHPPRTCPWICERLEVVKPQPAGS